MKYLDLVKNPDDLKKLSLSELYKYASETREFLLKSVANTGGHLSSNLGVVELSIALHYCFNSPRDKLVFDVGHQGYVHKLITGRLQAFDSLRKLNGLSGFLDPKESEHDAFKTGHASNSISIALGYALGRDLLGEDNNVISIIGDGAMTGGLAYEALNNAGRTNTDLKVILNDNDMSISENVGAISKYLNKLRTANAYMEVKGELKSLLDKIHFKGLSRMMSKTKQGIRYMLVPGMFFEELGFKYIGPIDGHDIKSLIITLNMSKNLKGPVLIHVNTKKGKGYGYSEVWPGRFHGVELFDIVTGESKKVKKLSYSDIFANTLEELADKDKSIVAITAAMLIGVGLDHFAKTYPDRTFDVGIAEAHAVTFAAGLACGGLKPVVAIYSTFLQRAFDSIIHDVCIQNLPVVFAVDRAGIVGVDGETHQGLFDIGYLSIIPNMTVMAPKNGQELSSMLKFAFKLNSPVAIRYPKEEISSLFEDIDSPIVYGKAEYIYRAYGDYRVAIVSVGAMINTAYGVYKFFKKDEICAALINARFMKPLDMDMMTDLAGYDRVVVIEDASIVSGFGSNLLSAMNINGISTSNLRIFAFPDKFIQAGSREQLFDMYSLTPEKIYDQIREH